MQSTILHTSYILIFYYYSFCKIQSFFHIIQKSDFPRGAVAPRLRADRLLPVVPHPTPFHFVSPIAFTSCLLFPLYHILGKAGSLPEISSFIACVPHRRAISRNTSTNTYIIFHQAYRLLLDKSETPYGDNLVTLFRAS